MAGRRAEVPPAAELPSGILPSTVTNAEAANTLGGVEEMVAAVDVSDGLNDLSQILKQMENADHALRFFETKAEEVLAKLNAMLVEAGISPDDEFKVANESANFEEGISIAQSALEEDGPGGRKESLVFDSSFTSPFINGRFKDIETLSSTHHVTHSIVNPTTRKPLVSIHEATVADVQQATDAAAAALKGEWGSWSGSKRRDALLRLADAMEIQSEELAAAEALTGKTIVDARADVSASIDCVRFYAASLTTSHRTTNGEPILPPGVVNVLPGGSDVGASLVQHPNVQKISFTGSTSAGRKVGSSAILSGPGLRKPTLELGGKNPVIVFEDADLDEAVTHAVEAGFSNAGQNCCAGSRFLVHSAVHDAFIEKLEGRVAGLVVGNPLNSATQIGPLVDEAAFGKVSGYIQRGIEDGLELVFGGKPLQSEGFFVAPTAFKNVPDSHPLATDEIFGPVIAVLKPFTSLSEAISRANASPYGLAAGVMTSSHRTAETCIQNLRTGIVWVNTYNFVPPFLPLGGVGESGFGKDCGLEALDEFSHMKAVYSAF
ncbi:hypothetical protein HDU96_009769 [Phlyctochytrium bullatum]|nr:hypothetical protein HDU96_009769 [Phlyctochytrium bullatum]